MKTYKNEITLNKNNRGCYILDTVKGCGTCLSIYPDGCYGECYAKKIAGRYGFDFSKSVNRTFKEKKDQLFFFDFKDIRNVDEIRKSIKKSDMPFIRIGEMGDPSEDWQHTINICKQIYDCGKKIVIITKHWKTITNKQLDDIQKLNLYINTSISALDTEEQFAHRLIQFYRLKHYCNSVLRIVSCDFNKNNEEGLSRSLIQDELFTHAPNIDTAFRPSIKNRLVTEEIINVEKAKFLSKDVLISKFNKNVYIGNCKNCPDMCGVNKI